MYPSLVIVKAPKSMCADTDAANFFEQHGLGRTLWGSVEPLQKELELYGNVKDRRFSFLLA